MQHLIGKRAKISVFATFVVGFGSKLGLMCHQHQKHQNCTATCNKTL